MADHPPHVLGLGGTTRTGSSTEQALRHALAAAETAGATTAALSGAELAELPMYAPERPARTAGAVRLVDQMRRADGIILASPGYHGSVSGLVKNAVDYAEDLRGDDPGYWSGRAIGCIATGAGWQAVVQTLSQLRTIAHALRGWPTPLGAAINTSLPFFEGDGIVDERARTQLETVGWEVVQFAVARLSGGWPQHTAR